MKEWFPIWIVLAALTGMLVNKYGCTSIHLKMCRAICDLEDRELDRIKPGFRTECHCGSRKVHIYDKKLP